MTRSEKRVVFRHTPKCAGTYIWNSLKSLGSYISLGDRDMYRNLCPENILNFYNIQAGHGEIGVVENNCNDNIPRVIRAHSCLNHLNINNVDRDTIVISNIRHPVTKFYSEFYHHHGTPHGIKWARSLGNSIDDFIDGAYINDSRAGPVNLEQWNRSYINTINNLQQQVHYIIIQEETQKGIADLNDMGLNIQPYPKCKNVTPKYYRNKYTYRIDDISRALDLAIESYQHFLHNS